MKTKLPILLIFGMITLMPSKVQSQSVLFDFDNAPVYTPLPISQTVSGLTAHFSATDQGYSIQSVSTATVVPNGFTGNFIFPSSINLSDLLIKFDQPISDFSIWYSPQELACDTSATMRVTAYYKSNYVGTNTKIAAAPGTWPVDSVKCSFAQGFDSVVVHFDSHPALCQDWGPIFIADNMKVTLLKVTSYKEPLNNLTELTISNPFSNQLNIHYLNNEVVTLLMYDIQGKQVLKESFTNSSILNTGNLENGIYIYEIRNAKGTMNIGKLIKY